MSKRKKRTAHRLGGMEQRVLLPVEPEPTASEETKPGAAQEHHFHVGKRDKLFVAEERLSTYLERNGNGWVLRLEEAIRKLDLTSLLAGYSTQGRHALHPRLVLGLIVFGLLLQQTSLRALERLARFDVRAWWITGGEQPDHSTIGKFVIQHAEALPTEVFDALVRQLVASLNLKTSDAAIDG